MTDKTNTPAPRRTPETYKGDPLRGFGRGGPSRPWLLYLLPLPLFVAVPGALAGGNDASRVIGGVLALALLYAGAVAVHRGMQAAREYERRAVAAAPKLPLKMIGAVLVAAGTGITATMMAGYNVVFGGLFALGALAGSIMAYGTDPRRDKGDAAGAGYTAAEIAGMLSAAEAKIAEIEALRKTVRTDAIRDRLAGVTARAHDVVEALANDPKDIRKARNFLNIYLDRVSDIGRGFAQAEKGGKALPELETSMGAALDGVGRAFSTLHDKIMADDTADLEVQLEVLKLRLEEEGVM